MGKEMNHRDFLTMDDVTPQELRKLVKKTHRIHEDWEQNRHAKNILDNVEVTTIFEKPSLRTALSTEVGVRRHGGRITRMDGKDMFKRSDGKVREAIQDIARTVSQYSDVIAARLFSHATLQELAKHSSSPVINLLTDREHPAQAVASIAAIRATLGKQYDSVSAAWIGDGNNVAVSLGKGLVKLGVKKFAVAAPKKFWIPEDEWRKMRQYADENGSTILQTEDPEEAIQGANYAATDTFVSMGQEAENDERVQAFRGFQINGELLSKAAPNVMVGHCLPAHEGEEITRDVIEDHSNEIFDREANMRLASFVAIVNLMLKGHR